MKNTKSLLALILACMMVVSCFVVTPVVAADEEVWDEWDGNVDADWETSAWNADKNAYYITTAEQLAGLAASVNDGTGVGKGEAEDGVAYKNCNFYLAANLRLNSEADIANFANWGSSAPAHNWTPIGNATYKFGGNFYATDYTIEGMYVKSSANAGLFGRVDDSFEVTRLYMNNCYSQTTGSSTYAAILVAQLQGGGTTIGEIRISDSKVVAPTGNGNGAAAVLGQTASVGSLTFRGCTVSNTTVTNKECVGLILGRFHGALTGTLKFTGCKVTDCTANGGFAGGIMGALTSGSVTGDIVFSDCEVKNSMLGKSGGVYTAAVFGGINCTATSSDVSFTNITTDGNTVTGAKGMAGLLGYTKTTFATLTVTDVTCKDTITATDNGAGGIVGRFPYSPAKMTFKNVTMQSGGSINGKQAVGGIIGYLNEYTTSVCNSLTLENCDVNYDITGTYWVAGLVGTGYNAPATLIVDGCDINANITETTGSATGHGAAGMFADLPRSTGTTTMTATVKNSTVNGTIKSPYIASGMFAKLAQAPVAKLTVENCEVGATIFSTGRVHACGIVALATASKLAEVVVDNYTFTGTLKNAKWSSPVIGEVVGSDITVTNSNIGGSFTGNDGDKASSSDYCGGIVGLAKETDVSVEGTTITVNVNGSAYLGGVVGGLGAKGTETTGNVTVTDCIIEPTITSASYNHISPVIGVFTSSGNVIVEGTYIGGSATALGARVGGVIGASEVGNGTVSVNNVLFDASLKGSHYVGGVAGAVAQTGATYKVTNSVFLGSYETTSAEEAAATGVLFGRYAADGLTVNNVYYNVDSFKAGDGTLVGLGTFAEGTFAETPVFYTPFADATVGATKQANINILYFLEAMKDVDAAWVGMDHECEAVTMDQETAVDDEKYAMDGNWTTEALQMTLECQIPGCTHGNHKVTGDIGVKTGVSYRTQEPAGIRFGFRLDEALKDGANMGIIMIPTDMLQDGEELTVNTKNVAKAVAANTFGTDSKYYVDGCVSFAGVLVGLPEEDHDRDITARAYVKIGDTYYYSTASHASYDSAYANN